MFRADLTRRAEKVLLWSASLLYLVYTMRNAFRIDGELYFSLFDDAMISMRYGRNLAEGLGLVWNPGEAPVEGYTNFLWTLVMALAHLSGLPDSKVSLLVVLVSAACLIANAFVVRRMADLLSGGNGFARVTAFGLTLFSYPLIFWSLRGMEVGFLTLIVDVALLAALELHERYDAGKVAVLCACSVLALLTRPDGIVPIAIYGGFAALALTGGARWKLVLGLGLSVGATLAGHTLFRHLYYHELLPNTYYLKVTGTPLSARLAQGAPALLRTLVIELWLLFVIPLALFVRTPKRFADRRILMLCTLFVIQCLYSMYVGGDAWEQLAIANRYISTALPAAFVVIGVLLGELLDQGADETLRFMFSLVAVTALVALVGTSLYTLALPQTSWRYLFPNATARYVAIDLAILVAAIVVWKRGMPRAPWLSAALLIAPLWLSLDAVGFISWKRNRAAEVDEEMTRIGVAVKALTKPDARLAVTYAGAPPYFARRPSADLLGKCDPVIARRDSYLPFLPGHSKWDYHHTIPTYRPDLILQTWRLNADDRTYLAENGYVRLRNGIYYRRGSSALNREEELAALPFVMQHIYEQ